VLLRSKISRHQHGSDADGVSDFSCANAVVATFGKCGECGSKQVRPRGARINGIETDMEVPPDMDESTESR
jgi:hypothetical protein